MDFKNVGQPAQITKETVLNSPQVFCESCGNGFFVEKMLFKKISALISPTGKAELFPLNAVVCDKCGLVSSDFNPQKLIPEQYLAENKNKVLNTNNQ